MYYPNGMTIYELFSEHNGLTLQNFLALPEEEYFTENEINLKTRLTKNIEINYPLIASPMDTVTEFETAKVAAELGCAAFLHMNMSIEKQVQQVIDLKRYQNGFIHNPVTICPETKIFKLKGCKYSNIPITENGLSDGKLVGMLTVFDYDFEENANSPAKEHMIPIEKLSYIQERDLYVNGKLSLARANHYLKKHRCHAMPIVNDNGNLKYLVTYKDIMKTSAYPQATIDRDGSLIAAAAVSTKDEDIERIDRLAEAKVDIILLDKAHGHSIYMKRIKYIKEKYPHIDVVAGNVVTPKGVRYLIDLGVDAIRVGMGIGSICTTQGVTGVGRPQGDAVFYCVQEARKHGIPIIADGGFNDTGTVNLALALGASSVMSGRLFAGTDQTPGKIIQDGNKLMKFYRGMGSAQAMEYGSGARYSQSSVKSIRAEEGKEGLVPYIGCLTKWLPLKFAAMKQGFSKLGSKSIPELQKRVLEEVDDAIRIRFTYRPESAIREGNIHDLLLVQHFEHE